MPLDVAADRGDLLAAGRFAGEHRRDRRPQVAAIAGDGVAGPAAIELAPVGQGVAAASPVPAKQEGVGGAGRGKRLGHLLAAVQEVREGPAAALGLGPQALGAVGGVPRGSIDDGVRAMACAKLGSL